jgi:hypothetical protein
VWLSRLCCLDFSFLGWVGLDWAGLNWLAMSHGLYQYDICLLMGHLV